MIAERALSRRGRNDVVKDAGAVLEEEGLKRKNLGLGSEQDEQGRRSSLVCRGRMRR